MKNSVKKAVALGTGTALALGGVAGTALAGTVSADAPQPQPQAASTVATVSASNIQKVADVQGTFTFAQGQVDSIETIARSLGDASKHLCGSSFQGTGAAPAEEWVISVGGAVENPYSATIGEIIEREETEHVVMGCSCAGNPADGRASINAEVTGVSVLCILDEAVMCEGANTIVFASADGYEVALPLWYVQQHYCPLVFAVNGSPLIDSVGGTNQLWLGASSAKYFARDIVSITLEEREVMPPAPDSDTVANLPNVGVAFGGSIE